MLHKYYCLYLWIGVVNGLAFLSSFILSLLLYSDVLDSGSDEIPCQKKFVRWLLVIKMPCFMLILLYIFLLNGIRIMNSHVDKMAIVGLVDLFLLACLLVSFIFLYLLVKREMVLI